MKFISKIITSLMQKELPKPLGRWNINYCNQKINRKIDLSNEDHCGPCGEYSIEKRDLHENNTDVTDVTDKSK